MTAGPLGMSLPESVAPGEEFVIDVSGGPDRLRPIDLSCRITDAAAAVVVAAPPFEAGVQGPRCRASIDQPGLYRVEVMLGSHEPVTQLILVGPHAYG